MTIADASTATTSGTLPRNNNIIVIIVIIIPLPPLEPSEHELKCPTIRGAGGDALQHAGGDGLALVYEAYPLGCGEKCRRVRLFFSLHVGTVVF